MLRKGSITRRESILERTEQIFKHMECLRALENYLWDIPQYFGTLGSLTEEASVRAAAMYLDGDGKLWWRTKMEDVKNGRPFAR